MRSTTFVSKVSIECTGDDCSLDIVVGERRCARWCVDTSGEELVEGQLPLGKFCRLCVRLQRDQLDPLAEQRPESGNRGGGRFVYGGLNFDWVHPASSHTLAELSA